MKFQVLKQLSKLIKNMELGNSFGMPKTDLHPAPVGLNLYV